MANMNPNISIITLNMYGPNIPIQRQIVRVDKTKVQLYVAYKYLTLNIKTQFKSSKGMKTDILQ